MSDFEAVPMEAVAVPQRLAGRVEDAREFLGGLLLTLAVCVVGTVVLTAALVIGVVGSPLLAAAIAYVVVRHRRAARQRAVSPWKPA